MLHYARSLGARQVASVLTYRVVRRNLDVVWMIVWVHAIRLDIYDAKMGTQENTKESGGEARDKEMANVGSQVVTLGKTARDHPV